MPVCVEYVRHCSTFYLETHEENKLCLPVQVLKSLPLLHASVQNPGVKVQQPE